MKIFYCISIISLLFSSTFCKSLNQKNDLGCLFFFPENKENILKTGYIIQNSAITNLYSKNLNDTIVFFRFCDKTDSYYKLVRFNLHTIDTNQLFNYFKKLDSDFKVNSKSLLLKDKRDSAYEYQLYFNDQKTFLELLFTSPYYMKDLEEEGGLNEPPKEEQI